MYIVSVIVSNYMLCSGDGDNISMSSMDNPEQFESKKQLKELMQQGLRL